MNTPPVGVKQPVSIPVDRQVLNHFTQKVSFPSQGGIVVAMHGLTGQHSFTVGRHDDNHNGVLWKDGLFITTPHPATSKNHLQITYDSTSQTVQINSFSTTNGTYYQGHRINGSLKLLARGQSQITLNLGQPPSGTPLTLVFSNAHAQATKIIPIQDSAYVMAPPPAVLPISASKHSPYQENMKLLKNFRDVVKPGHAGIFGPDFLIQGSLKKWNVVLDAQGRIVQIQGRHKWHEFGRLPQPGDISVPLIVTPDNALVWYGDSSVNQPQQEALRSWYQDTEKLTQQHQTRYPLSLELAFGLYPELGCRGHFGKVAFSLFQMIQNVQSFGQTQNVIVRLYRNAMGNIETWLPHHGNAERPDGDFVGEVMLNLEPAPRSGNFNREISIRCGYVNSQGMNQDEQKKFAQVIKHIQHWFQPYVSKPPAQAPVIPSLMPAPLKPSSGILERLLGRKKASSAPPSSPAAVAYPLAGKTQAVDGMGLGEMMQGEAKPAHWAPASPAHWKKDSQGILYYQMPLSQSHILIGREGDETIHGDERVSRRHLVIERMDGDDFTVVAMNHVVLNGEVIPEGQKTWIRRGDVVALTPDVSFIFDPVPPQGQ